MTKEEIMTVWDFWRSQIAEGHKGSAPRDWLESVIDDYEDRITKLEKEIRSK